MATTRNSGGWGTENETEGQIDHLRASVRRMAHRFLRCPAQADKLAEDVTAKAGRETLPGQNPEAIKLFLFKIMHATASADLSLRAAPDDEASRSTHR